jgi:hypothetical protein
MLDPDRPFSLRWVWRWRSMAGQVNSTAWSRWLRPTLGDDPAPRQRSARTQSCVGARCWPRHEAAWVRWTSDVLIEGDGIAARNSFAVYHLTSAANPEEAACP